MSKIDFGGTVHADPNRRKGVISGVDTESIIQAAVDKRKVPIKLEQDKASFTNEKVAALSELIGLLTSFQSSLTSIKGLQFSEDGTDALQGTLPTLSAPVSEDPSNFLSISTTPDAALGNFTVQVTQVAQSHMIQSVSFSSNSTSATNATGSNSNLNLFTPGTFQINGVSVTINQGDTLSIIAANINSLSSTSNVTAQVINPITGAYQLLLQSTISGAANSIVFSDPSNVLNSVISGGAVLQQPQDAIFIYNTGVTVQRPSNIISDFINGVVFTLYNKSQITIYNPAPTQQPFTINVSVSSNINNAVAGIQSFVSTYNALMKFITQQQGRDEYGHYHHTAKIQHDDYIANLATNITILASQVAYVQSSSNGFGITLVAETQSNLVTGEPVYKNLLALDTTVLTNALNTNFENVRTQFEFSLTSNVNDFLLYSHGNQITNGTVTVDIDITRLDIVRTTYNGNTIDANFTPNNPLDLTQGGIIAGVSGTFMDGYQLVYSGTGSEVFNITISQGVADQIYNIVSPAIDIDPNTGTSILQDAINSLIQENYYRNNAIRDKLKALEEYKASLVQKYSRMEASIAKANMVLTFLEAQLKAMEKR